VRFSANRMNQPRSRLTGRLFGDIIEKLSHAC
jgi:hypothetical protein